jgi:hypothetical protein
MWGRSLFCWGSLRSSQPMRAADRCFIAPPRPGRGWGGAGFQGSQASGIKQQKRSGKASPFFGERAWKPLGARASLPHDLPVDRMTRRLRAGRPRSQTTQTVERSCRNVGVRCDYSNLCGLFWRGRWGFASLGEGGVARRSRVTEGVGTESEQKMTLAVFITVATPSDSPSASHLPQEEGFVLRRFASEGALFHANGHGARRHPG